MCTVKCDIRGTEHSFTALKVVVAESATSPTPLTSGEFYNLNPDIQLV